jgi:hypothetical protein
MTFTFEVNVFKNLLESYPTWEQLQTYLESEEGGLFRIVDTDEKGHALIRYEKGSSNMNLPHSKWFRSVVWDTKRNRPVCVAPCKTSMEDFPYLTLQEVQDAGMICQENVEGFMINCFQSIDHPNVHITSRSKLNAAGTFYSTKSFSELFVDAYQDTFDGCLEVTWMQTPKKEEQEMSVFYSFLVQHVEHKIVKNNNMNCVYVIYKGTVYEDGRIVIEDTPSSAETIPAISIPSSREKVHSYAQVVSQTSTLSEVQEWCKDIIQDLPSDCQGIVWKDRSGNRWRVRSEKYSAIRSLRGNSPSIRDRFCQLYVGNLIHKYLEYYPEDSWGMSVCLMHTNSIIKTLYDLYVELHIRKTKKIEEIDKMFHPHLYHLHGFYLSQLRPNQKVMTQHAVQVYLHKQPWQRLSFLIRKVTNHSAEVGQVE